MPASSEPPKSTSRTTKPRQRDPPDDERGGVQPTKYKGAQPERDPFPQVERALKRKVDGEKDETEPNKRLKNAPNLWPKIQPPSLKRSLALTKTTGLTAPNGLTNSPSHSSQASGSRPTGRTHSSPAGGTSTINRPATPSTLSSYINPFIPTQPAETPRRREPVETPMQLDDPAPTPLGWKPVFNPSVSKPRVFSLSKSPMPPQRAFKRPASRPKPVNIQNPSGSAPEQTPGRSPSPAAPSLRNPRHHEISQANTTLKALSDENQVMRSELANLQLRFEMMSNESKASTQALQKRLKESTDMQDILLEQLSEQHTLIQDLFEKFHAFCCSALRPRA